MVSLILFKIIQLLKFCQLFVSLNCENLTYFVFNNVVKFWSRHVASKKVKGFKLMLKYLFS